MTNTIMVTSLELPKITHRELSFLQSIGWNNLNPWVICGNEPVEVSIYTDQITDKRFFDWKILTDSLPY